MLLGNPSPRPFPGGGAVCLVSLSPFAMLWPAVAALQLRSASSAVQKFGLPKR